MTAFIKDNLVSSLLAAFIVGAIISYGVLQNHESRISKLEEDEMSREVIELQLATIVSNSVNTDTKIDESIEKADKFYIKLVEHISQTKPSK